MRIRIANGRLIDPANQLDATRDLYIADGLIVGVGTAPSGFSADRTIDATNWSSRPASIALATSLMCA